MSRANRKDSNHAEIVAALRQAGALVLDAAQHAPEWGFDLLVLFHGEWSVMEIKQGKAKLTPNEIKARDEIASHGGKHYTPRSVDQALFAIGAIR